MDNGDLLKPLQKVDSDSRRPGRGEPVLFTRGKEGPDEFLERSKINEHLLT